MWLRGSVSAVGSGSNGRTRTTVGEWSGWRVSPVGRAYGTLGPCSQKPQEKCREVTHNHSGKVCTRKCRRLPPLCFWPGRVENHEQIKNYIEAEFGYQLEHTIG